MKKALFTLSEFFAFVFITTQKTFALNIAPTVPAQVVKADQFDLPGLVNFAITLLVVAGVLAALIFLILGGIKWITSGGDKTGVESARNHIVGAIIGLIIIVLSFVIIKIVFNLVGGTGNPLENLNILTL